MSQGISKTGIELLNLIAQQQETIIERLERLEKAHELTIQKEAYTTSEAAERLGRSEWTVRQWCNKNQIDGAHKIRGKGRTGEWRIPHAALVRLHTEGPKAIPSLCVPA